ncbi:calreticulin-like [Salvelinus alpinus]
MIYCTWRAGLLRFLLELLSNENQTSVWKREETVNSVWGLQWVESKHKSDYGKFVLNAGKFYGDAEKDKGVENPANKGKWVHPEIDNPDDTADPEIYQYASMGVIRFVAGEVRDYF